MYRKRYEDSYLDEEDNDLEQTDKSDGERIVGILLKSVRTELDEANLKKLTERLFNGLKLPDPVGREALEDIALVAGHYKSAEMPDRASALWARVMEVAEATGNREMYYMAEDRMLE